MTGHVRVAIKASKVGGPRALSNSRTFPSWSLHGVTQRRRVREPCASALGAIPARFPPGSGTQKGAESTEQSRTEEEGKRQPGSRSHGNGRQLRVLLGDAAVPGVRGAQHLPGYAGRRPVLLRLQLAGRLHLQLVLGAGGGDGDHGGGRKGGGGPRRRGRRCGGGGGGGGREQEHPHGARPPAQAQREALRAAQRRAQHHQDGQGVDHQGRDRVHRAAAGGGAADAAGGARSGGRRRRGALRLRVRRGRAPAGGGAGEEEDEADAVRAFVLRPGARGGPGAASVGGGRPRAGGQRDVRQGPRRHGPRVPRRRGAPAPRHHRQHHLRRWVRHAHHLRRGGFGSSKSYSNEAHD